MTMIAGSVDRTSINPATGAAGTSSGFAGVVYAWAVTYYAGLATPQPPVAPTVGSTANPFSVERPCNAGDVAHYTAARLALFQLWADQANFAAQLVTYLLGNAHAHVTTQQLGTLPAGTGPGTPIAPPPIAVDIPLA